MRSEAVRPSASAANSWKWVIAGSCCWINAFVFGVFRSAGVLYIAFVAAFGCSYQEASWPISMAGSVASITGVMAGFLSHYFRVRTLVCIGVFVCSTATSVCYFADTIHFVIVSLGVIQGIGIGLVTTLLPAIISHYFGRQRAAACGVSYAGATAGAFVFPMFIDWQLNRFGLRGTLLLMGGITLHGLIGALLLRPIESGNGADGRRNKSSFSRENGDPNNKEPLIEVCETVVFLEDSDHQYANINAHKFRERPKSIAEFSPAVKMRDSYHHERSYRSHNRLSMPVIIERKSAHSPLNGLSVHNRRPDADIEERRTGFWSGVRSQFGADIRILLDVHFQLCTITYITFIIDFVAFLIILPDFARDRGLSGQEGTLLLSLYSITDLFGRLIPGWISYLDIVTNKNIYIASIAIMGICFLITPTLANSFAIMATLTLVCGFVGGCQMVLPPVVLSEYLGAERTAIAFGLSNFLCGILALIFRPIIIGLKDRTGNYNALFYILGSLAVGSAALWLLELIRYFILKCWKSR